MQGWMLECGGDPRLWKLGLACTAKEEGSGGKETPRDLGDPSAEKDRESGYGLKGGLDEPRERGGPAEMLEKRPRVEDQGTVSVWGRACGVLGSLEVCKLYRLLL